MSDEISRRRGAERVRSPLPGPRETTNTDTPELYEFGPFCLDPRERKLMRGSEMVALTPKTFDTLHLLVRNSGRLLERDQLITQLWPDSFVEGGNLSNNISVLRKALGEDPQYIETVPKRGYRFVGNVRRLSSPTAISLIDSSPSQSNFLAHARQSDALFEARIRRVGTTLAAISIIVLVITAIAWRVSRRVGTPTKSGPQIRSLAVLPIQNLSGDPSQDFLADGMTEELITQLGESSALRIISRTSVTQYKGTKKPVREIARELNVDAVLEGTVLRSGNHLRITANLVQSSPETHLWAQTYDSEDGDILGVQQRVADSVAQEIRVALLPRDSTVLGDGRSVNPEAQDLYFRGLYALRSAGGGATQTAIDYLQRAIRKDPNFARAYGALAMAYAVWYPGDSGPRVNMPRAREAALKALTLDNSLAAGHMALAYVDLNYDWNFAEAEAESKRALQLDPNSAIARKFYARELVILGRNDEAFAQVKRALELEPYAGLDYPAWVFYLAHRYTDALELAQKMVAIDPNFSWGRWALAVNYEQLGKEKEAAKEYLQFEILSGSSPQRISRLREGLARLGAKGFWQASLEDYLRSAKSGYAPPVLVAGVWMRLGDKARALQWLEKGFQARDDLMIDLNVDPVFAALRSEPRFQDLARRVGLPDGKPHT